MTNIQISLPESMKVFVEKQVAKGDYSSASEYLQELIFQAQQCKSQEGKRTQADGEASDAGSAER